MSWAEGSGAKTAAWCVRGVPAGTLAFCHFLESIRCGFYLRTNSGELSLTRLPSHFPNISSETRDRVRFPVTEPDHLPLFCHNFGATVKRWLLGSRASTLSDGATAPESWELENCVPSWVPLLCPRGEPVSPPGSGAPTPPVVTAGLVWD